MAILVDLLEPRMRGPREDKAQTGEQARRVDGKADAV